MLAAGRYDPLVCDFVLVARFCGGVSVCLSLQVADLPVAIAVLAVTGCLHINSRPREDPGNQYVNSVTILDGHDNTFNEDTLIPAAAPIARYCQHKDKADAAHPGLPRRSSSFSIDALD